MREIFTTLFVFAAAFMLWRSMRPQQRHGSLQVATPSQMHAAEAFDIEFYKWPSLGKFNFPVADSSRYQAALKQVAEGTPIGPKGTHVVVQLLTETDNPDTWKPVEVRIRNQRVGFLSPGDASRFHRRLAYEGRASQTTCCDAIITLTNNYYDIRLDLKEFRH